MKRHPALHTLSHDHHQGLILSQQLKKGAPQYKGMPSTIESKKEYTQQFYKSELVQHFKDEEEILFPLVAKKVGDVDNMISEIISEHRKMESLVNELDKTQELEYILDELGQILEKHIRKEERELFVEIEKNLSEAELNDLSEKLKASRIRKV
ncbi:MAG: hemerythrin domain-containing protein [Ignavibacteriaceae bacterium]|nr:hemerythrin domain-containing protein [Ignavibacteriaceae bacterium]